RSRSDGSDCRRGRIGPRASPYTLSVTKTRPRVGFDPQRTSNGAHPYATWSSHPARLLACTWLLGTAAPPKCLWPCVPGKHSPDRSRPDPPRGTATHLTPAWGRRARVWLWHPRFLLRFRFVRLY